VTTARPAVALTVVLALEALTASPAEAKSGGGSGGYSRPQQSRTPSVASRDRSSAAGSSGGYSRPERRTPSVTSRETAQSAVDREIGRTASKAALDAWRDERKPSTSSSVDRDETDRREPREARDRTRSSDWAWESGGGRRDRTPTTISARKLPPWESSWTAPAWARDAATSYGVWRAPFLWWLLDTVNEPGHAAFFHHHAEDPGYREWRANADRQAESSRPLAGRLDTLDTRLQTMDSTPRNPEFLPAGVSAGDARTDDGGLIVLIIGLVVLAVIVGIVIFMIVILYRFVRKLLSGTKKATPVPTGGNKTRLRLGQVLIIDPSAFLLAQGKVPAPELAAGESMLSVTALGQVTGGPAEWWRLHLNDDTFVQVHLGADGTPDECRWFARIDTVEPADAGEWDFWLGRKDGMIGHPEFQTKDGQAYARHWSPGSSRVAPLVLEERRQTESGERTLRHTAMLYSAPTGVEDPPTEYILVSVVENEGTAWVDIHAGLDIHPSALSL